MHHSLKGACFVIRDGDKQALAYVYFENEPGRRSSAKLLTRDEAFLLAVNIAKLRVAAGRPMDSDWAANEPNQD